MRTMSELIAIHKKAQLTVGVSGLSKHGKIHKQRLPDGALSCEL